MITDMDAVFRALADPSRRRLLDVLFEYDGQTLTELTTQLPMSRFGARKHLQILEEAGLIVIRWEGRSKHHYLNPVPIRLIQERWIGKYAEPWVGALTGIKEQLEGKEDGEAKARVPNLRARERGRRLEVDHRG